MSGSAASIEAYIRAKDENRPHLLGRAFKPAATVEMIVNTGAISFPPFARGIDAIADMLVRQFGQAYENVYTFCLSVPPEDHCLHYSCDWLVGMSDKKTRSGRVGYGRYDWSFATDDNCLVEKLRITIETMQIVDPSCVARIMEWLSITPYPWCPIDVAAKGAARIEELRDIADRLFAAGGSMGKLTSTP